MQHKWDDLRDIKFDNWAVTCNYYQIDSTDYEWKPDNRGLKRDWMIITGELVAYFKRQVVELDPSALSYAGPCLSLSPSSLPLFLILPSLLALCWFLSQVGSLYVTEKIYQ